MNLGDSLHKGVTVIAGDGLGGGCTKERKGSEVPLRLVGWLVFFLNSIEGGIPRVTLYPVSPI